MNKKQKLILAIMSLIVIFIIILLLMLNSKSKENMEVNSNADADEINIFGEKDYNNTIYKDYNKSEINKKLEALDIYSRYNLVDSISNKYIQNTGLQQADILLKMLATDYKEKYKINKENVLKIKTDIPMLKGKEEYKTILTSAIGAEVEKNIYVYIVKGVGRVTGTEKRFEYNILIEIDEEEATYAIYPDQYIKDKEYDKLKIGSTINYDVNKIIRNDNNEFMYDTESDKKIANSYFSNYSELLEYYPEEAYNRLDSEYKNARYKSLEAFKEYVSKISYTIYTMNINKYKVHKTDNYTDYLCTDQYNNYYIFREKDGIMNYTVFLDSYTVDLDVFKENYEKASDEEKVSLNVGKFKQMLNTKDYNTIYNKLNETFRKNNFSTVSKLEEYLKKNTYEINSIKVENKNQQNDYYVCECTLVDQTNTEQTKKMTIMIKLLDNNNFSMSFSIK